MYRQGSGYAHQVKLLSLYIRSSIQLINENHYQRKKVNNHQQKEPKTTRSKLTRPSPSQARRSSRKARGRIRRDRRIWR